MSQAAAERFLILETSGKVGQVALALGESLIGQRGLDETRRHARDLAPAVADLLAAASWKPRDLQGVIVSRGPGSYTGLRVGIMAAKVFAYATGAALVAVDTFAAIAAQAPPEVNLLDILADAQQGKIYVQTFRREGHGAEPQPVSPLVIRPFAEWLASRDLSGWVSGPGLRPHVSQLPAGNQIVPAEDWDPRPENLLRLGLRRYRTGVRDDPWALEPLYLRPSAAEEQWTKRG